MKWKQITSLVLSAAMLVGLCPQNVSATQETNRNVEVVQEQDENETTDCEHITGTPKVVKKYQSDKGMGFNKKAEEKPMLLSNDSARTTYYLPNDAPEVMEKVQEIAQECRDAGIEDEWDIALWLHDWLIYNANYDLTYSIYHAYGVLLEGTGVCQSYAEAYQLLLNEFGIENMLVTSMEMNHAWNMVKINGVWCHVDCTWDDPISYDENGNEVAGGYERQFYFGLSDAEMNTDHVWPMEYYPKCTSNRNSILFLSSEINLVENVEELEELFLNMYELQAEYFECYYVGSDENLVLVDEMAAILYQYDNLMLNWNLWYGDDYVMVYVYFDEFDGQHTHRYKGLPVAPYCEVSGGILYKCACGYMYESDFTNALEHEWSDWEITQTPTFTEPGTSTRMCEICWKEESMEVAAGNVTGSCGENLTWELNEDGVLTISGTGDMYDMDYRQPWEDYCADITSVVIENGVTSIGNSAFYLCTNMTSIEIPNSVTSIGEYAFNNCKSLTNVKIPNSITTISPGAFYYCENLKKVEIPSSVTSIEAMAFCGCYSLENVEIPSGVTILAGGAFEWCYGLTHMEIPDGITAIESGVFWGCENLESVKIPASVTLIDECAFLYCENLTDVYYGGTEEMWSEIYFGPYTDEVQNATIHFEGQGDNPGEDEKPEVTDVFSDVRAEDWFVDSIQFVYDNGMMSGSDGSFKPYDNMTRAMMVTTLYRLCGSPSIAGTLASNFFHDVESGSWYENAVTWAYDTNVTTGYTDADGNPTHFGSYDNVTREQLAVFLYRYAEMQGYDVTVRGNISGYVGANNVSDYAKSSMEWAVGVGLISGIESNVNGVTIYDLAPKGSATRAQLATILMRFCGYFVK